MVFKVFIMSMVLVQLIMGRRSKHMKERPGFLSDFARDLSDIFGRQLIRVILYGSYARGEQTKYSDLDIMILTTMHDNDIQKMENQVFDLAYDYELKYGIPISINIKNVDHFNEWAATLPYYRNVEREGMTLA